MGIRFEKDTILNWINEMGKYLRLLVDRYDAFDKKQEIFDCEKGYEEFFQKERAFFKDAEENELERFANELQIEQVRPLAQLLMYDGLMSEDKQLLSNAKLLLEWNMKKTGAFSFEDFEFLSKINSKL